MVGHETLEELEVSGGDFLTLAKHNVAFADDDFGKNFSGSAVGDGEVGACGPVLLATPDVGFDDPPGAYAGNRKCLRQIVDHGSARQARRRSRLSSVIDGMVDLITDQLNSACGSEVVQVFK